MSFECAAVTISNLRYPTSLSQLNRQLQTMHTLFFGEVQNIADAIQLWESYLSQVLDESVLRQLVEGDNTINITIPAPPSITDKFWDTYIRNTYFSKLRNAVVNIVA